MTMLWLMACVNSPPRLVSLNGRPTQQYQHDFGWVVIPVQEGLYHLKAVVADAEGDAVRLFFPGAVGELRFDPDEREGTWDPGGLIDDTGVCPSRSCLEIQLVDDHDPPGSTRWSVEFDTGASGGSGR